MGWGITSWLVLVRSLQLVASSIACGINGYVLAKFSTVLFHSSPPADFIVLEGFAACMVVHTLLAITVLHTGQRSRSTSWLVSYIVSDVIFCAMAITAITILAGYGLPRSCQAVQHISYDYNIFGGYIYICYIERAYFFIAVGYVFSFISTIVLSVLCIYEKSHTRNAQVNELLSSLEHISETEQKLLMTPIIGSQADLAAPKAPYGNTSGSSSRHSLRETRLAHVAPSEGIITRNTSVRSAMTASTAAAGAAAAALANPHRALGMPAPRSIPRRPVPPSPQAVHGAGAALGMRVPMAASADESANAALVSDGMLHQYHAEDSQRMPMLPEEDREANSALVSDGMRFAEPALPPYEPARRGPAMPGHGTESNDMRLSDYVKGQTRAQTMKDGGGY